MYVEMNEDEITAYQNLLGTVKALLRGTFTAINGYIEKHKDFKSITYFVFYGTRKRWDKIDININSIKGSTIQCNPYHISNKPF